MNADPNIPWQLRELFPKASDELLRLFAAAEESGAFLRSDAHTIQDWLAVAGYDSEPLHAALLLLILALEEGSLCIELSVESLSRRMQDLADPAAAASWAERIVAQLDSMDCGKLIGTAPAADRPVIKHEAGGRQFLYFQKYLVSELDFAGAFRVKLGSATSSSAGADSDAILRDVLPSQPLKLDDDQRRALQTALTRELTLVSGGPGTGKTSIVVTLLRCLLRAGVAPDRIALAAPTGRAAQRLADAVRQGAAGEGPAAEARLAGIAATTLHQLLRYDPNRDLFRRHAENQVPAEVVIVDEVSMVGLVLMAKLLAALAPRTRLVLLGDKDQLASVDAGAVLAHLVGERPATDPALAAATVILRTNHRSEPGIRDVAAAVNTQQTSVVDSLTSLEMPKEGESWAALAGEHGVRLLEQKSQTAGEIRRVLRAWADYAFLGSGFREALADCATLADADPRRQQRLRELFHHFERTRLLTLIREGPWGCVEINRFLDQYLRPKLDRTSRGLLFAGAPVLVTRNDQDRGLFNGDVGVTVRDRGGNARVLFARQDSFVALPADALPAHELGFALTVHKSQGSEYGQVLLVFPPSGGRRLLTKELVYTGITRAKELAILCATRDVLKLAIGRKCLREAGVLRFDG